MASLELKFDQILSHWLGCGISILLGLMLWPIGNYSTLSYLLFYVPAIILLLHNRKRVSILISNADSPFTISITALLIWVVISTFWSIEKGDTFSLFFDNLKAATLITVFVLGVAMYIQHRQSHFKNYLAIAILFASVLSIITISNKIFLVTTTADLPNGYSIWSRISDFGWGSWTTKIHPVPAGIYFGTFTILASHLALTFKYPTKFYNYLMYLCSAICVVMTILTWSRTAGLALIIAAIIQLLQNGRIKATVVIISVGLLMLTFSIFIDGSPLSAHIFRNGIEGGRLDIWLASLKTSSESLIIGSGMGHDSTLRLSNSTSITQPHSHNFYLQLLFWCGIIGLMLYCAALYRMMKLCRHSVNQKYTNLVYTLVVYFTLAQLFDVYNIFTKPSYYWPSIWLPIAIFVAMQRVESKNSITKPI